MIVIFFDNIDYVQSDKYSGINASGYLSDLQMNGIAGAAAVVAYSDQTIYKYNGLYSMVGAIWNDQYILNINIRRDGSSRFGDERRFHNFGSIGVHDLELKILSRQRDTSLCIIMDQS